MLTPPLSPLEASPLSAAAKSSFPSPLKSPVATPMGALPAAKLLALENPINPPLKVMTADADFVGSAIDAAVRVAFTGGCDSLVGAAYQASPTEESLRFPQMLGSPEHPDNAHVTPLPDASLFAVALNS